MVWCLVMYLGCLCVCCPCVWGLQMVRNDCISTGQPGRNLAVSSTRCLHRAAVKMLLRPPLSWTLLKSRHSRGNKYLGKGWILESCLRRSWPSGRGTGKTHSPAATSSNSSRGLSPVGRWSLVWKARWLIVLMWVIEISQGDTEAGGQCFAQQSIG